MSYFPLDGFKMNQCELSNDEQHFILDCIYMAARESYYDTPFWRGYCDEMSLSIAEKFDIAKFGLSLNDFKDLLDHC